MHSEIFVAWFLTVFPLTFSPGPANTMFAASGASFGFIQTIPLMLGINLICLIQTLIIGTGMGELVFRYPSLMSIFKYLGCLFMLYLAYKFFRSSKVEKKHVKAPTFWDGCVLEFLNFKFLTIPMVMFSQFLSPNYSKMGQVLIMTVALNGLNMAGNCVWIAGGDAITRVFSTDRAAKIQGYVFGVILVCVAIWMALK
jgi:threonine/homoserine/homoserine lactone efflux protein